MTKAHRDRGKASELLAVKYLRGHGFGNAERSVATGVRNGTFVTADRGDITGTPGLAWQVKALKPLTRAENEVIPWMVETERNRVAAGADLGVLVLRRDQRPAEQWFAFMPLADLYALRGVDLPDVLAAQLGREAIVAQPARLYLGDLVTLLRGCGYGDPIVDPAQPATPARLERGLEVGLR